MKNFWLNRKKLKIWGTALLLFSFITQETFKNWAIEKQDEFHTMMLNYSLSDLTSENNMNLYFTSALATEEVNCELIRQAAQKKATGFISFILLTDISKDEKAKYVNKFRSQATKVDDIEKYNSLIAEINSIYTRIDSNVRQKNLFWRNVLSFSNKMYFLFYLIGTIFLIRGIKLETEK